MGCRKREPGDIKLIFGLFVKIIVKIANAIDEDCGNNLNLDQFVES